MGRCQSTPGLVESRGRIPLEEMWISPIDLRSTHPFSMSHSVFTPSPSPVPSRGVPSGNNSNLNSNARNPDSPTSAASSHSSEDPTARAAHLGTAQLSTGRQSSHSGKIYYNKQIFNNSFILQPKRGGSCRTFEIAHFPILHVFCYMLLFYIF